MARIDVLPSIEIIRGFKGILDFYLWRGLPCVRAWPRWRPARQTDASKAAALLFGAVIKAFSLTHGTVLEQLAPETTAIPRTARDIYVSGVYGNLHEASMSDFLDLLTQCRDFLSALTAILNALDSIDTDELVVNVDESALPAGAATAAKQLPDGHNVTVDNASIPVTGTFWQATQPISAAALPLPTGAATAAKQLPDGHNVTVDNASLAITAAALPLPAAAATAAAQATQLTALQKIDDLQDALESKALDRLLVRGMDQLHSYDQNLLSYRSAAISGDNGWLDSHTPAAGKVWLIAHCNASDLTTATTVHYYSVHRAAADHFFDQHAAAMPAGTTSWLHDWAWIHPGDTIRVHFIGGLAGDTCQVQLLGHIMTLET